VRGDNVEEITITREYRYSLKGFDVKASVDGDDVKMWFVYQDSGQIRYEIKIKKEEWDRLVAWVEWQRKNNIVNQKNSDV